MESHKPISNNKNITIKIIYNDTQLNYVYLYIMNYKLYIIIHSKSLIRFHGHVYLLVINSGISETYSK